MEKTAVIYWSATGNTEAMAKAIVEGIRKANAEADLFTVAEFGSNSLESYSRLAFGCPSMGAEVLEESDFEPFFTQADSIIAGKKVALFGSYGWGDGEWMRDWEARVRNDGANLYGDKGLIINLTPDDDGIKECEEFGAGFAKY